MKTLSEVEKGKQGKKGKITEEKEREGKKRKFETSGIQLQAMMISKEGVRERGRKERKGR